MERIPYASLVGSLMYAQTCTRPDISFAVGMLVRGTISWKSAKQFVIAAFTMEVEFMACFEATFHGLWL
ncbi:hypothetical protein CK203_117426 [Vitis vinifera]|uniref:Retrovirus-related Pol polyprotein from transposon TNT 1-94 n=1 Tax=Vitis vinifera TaxID=29760 RepID=A0A438CPY9_VITVI|nr:hypothetical protein CK203_117426 [Vitis vinifera]